MVEKYNYGLNLLQERWKAFENTAPESALHETKGVSSLLRDAAMRSMSGTRCSWHICLNINGFNNHFVSWANFLDNLSAIKFLLPGMWDAASFNVLAFVHRKISCKMLVKVTDRQPPCSFMGNKDKDK